MSKEENALTDHPSALGRPPADGTGLRDINARHVEQLHREAKRLGFSLVPAAPQAAGVGSREEIAQMICGFKLRQGKRTDTDKAWKDALETADRIISLRAPSREPEGGAVDARAVAKILNPALFSHDKVEAHRAASPHTVTSARIDAVDSVRKVLDAAALAALQAEQGAK